MYAITLSRQFQFSSFSLASSSSATSLFDPLAYDVAAHHPYAKPQVQLTPPYLLVLLMVLALRSRCTFVFIRAGRPRLLYKQGTLKQSDLLVLSQSWSPPALSCPYQTRHTPRPLLNSRVCHTLLLACIFSGRGGWTGHNLYNVHQAPPRPSLGPSFVPVPF